jgi:hypothetical protein
MRKFGKIVEAEIKAGTRCLVDNRDWTKVTIHDFARAHGYKFRYGGKFVRAISGAVTRPEVNGNGEVLDDDDDADEEEDE